MGVMKTLATKKATGRLSSVEQRYVDWLETKEAEHAEKVDFDTLDYEDGLNFEEDSDDT